MKSFACTRYSFSDISEKSLCKNQCDLQEFTKQFLEFSEELQHRVRDLIDRKIRNEFWITLICLQRLATSFTQVIKNIARYPLSRHIRVSILGTKH